MRRFFAFGVAWLAAAVVATVVAWQGVGLIGDQVTDKQSSTLSAAQVDAALASSTTTEPTGRSSTSGTPRHATTTTAPGSANPGTTGGGGTPAGGGPGATSGAPGPAATSPAPEPVRPILKTYQLTGGTATISFSPTSVRMVSAIPNPGYALTRNGAGDNDGVRVEFEGPAGRSRLDAWWAGGPQHRVDENPSGDGSGKGSPG